MSVTCCVCHKSSREVFCAHCMTSSPSLLLRRRIETAEAQKSRDLLREKVDVIMRKAMTGEAEELLSRHLMNLKILQLKRNISRMKYKLEQKRLSIHAKKQKFVSLQQEIVQGDENRRDSKDAKGGSPMGKRLNSEHNEIEQKLVQVSRVFFSTRALKFQELVKLFLVRQRDHPDFPFTISFQPVINLQNMYKLPQNVIRSSLDSIWEFVHIASRVLCVQVPLHGTSADVIESLAWLAMALLVLVRHFQLVPQNALDDRLVLQEILENYDIDGMFYHTLMNRDLDLPSVGEKRNPVDFEFCHWQVQLLLQSSGELSEINNSIDDKWFLVG
ncbi:LAMI_0D09362g1_1 [Lachancea mirantina]|uniref:Autophagy-related protein 14 n=1 Tax=Lachancea mirantina TaxID=1230905 RepID=A0A1G4JDU1_9SACH|nr:LAMI_0D09362g1_1 [Lachancea mirantina]